MQETINEGLINDKLQLAKLYFKSKRYSDALGAYNDIIALIKRYKVTNLENIYKLYKLPLPVIGELVHPKLLSILDQRAATYEKLGQVNKCLKDCQTSLDLCPIELKAYLRLGKNYSKLNDDLKAYKTYQSAYYTINRFKQKFPDSAAVSEPLFENLKMNYQTLNKKLKKRKLEPDTVDITDFKIKSISGKKFKKSKTSDPLEYLNDDVLQLIFGYINVPQLLKCHLVCKNWYSVITKFKSLYVNIKLKSRLKANEFTGGINFLKSLPKFNLLVNQTSNLECLKIIDSIIKNKLPILSLNLINLINYNQLLAKFDKHNFNFNFKLINHIKLITNYSNFNHLVGLFPNLTHLEIIVMNNDDDESIVIKNKQALKKLASHSCTLKGLVLINNNANAQNELLPPPIINQPSIVTNSLTKLIITSFDFNLIQHKFGEFLGDCSQLSILILENNKNLSFKIFLQNAINYQANFKLQKLIFREYMISDPLNLVEFQMIDDFKIFTELQHLDLYSISLTNSGLIKLLKNIPLLQSLTLGNSNFIYFKNDIINNFNKLNLIDLLKVLPNIKNLSLVDLNLDNLSLQYFSKDFNQSTTHLNNFELSFNNNINGIGLLNFLSDYNKNPQFSIKNLLLDGIQINKDTVDLVQAQYGIFIKNDHLRTKWRLYGLNSFVF